MSREFEALSVALAAAGREISKSLEGAVGSFKFAPIVMPNLTSVIREYERYFQSAPRISRKQVEATQAIVDRYRAAKELPEGHKAKGWALLGHLTPRQIQVLFAPHLPDPKARMRGRPQGSGVVLNDEALLADMHTRVLSGQRPTTAARELLRERGAKPETDIKNRVDHLVKIYQNRGNK